eukprot:TRINITY_DN27908_c0_g1_i1.p1 TRINITY_DN27908_c0_g1~~TRINITY_DN27908_c0_g1_i1.p1  ORF type:complete len:769 (+),score=184.81 TRINITY_DN27908_c0_g1_i1:32-2338(+)
MGCRGSKKEEKQKTLKEEIQENQLLNESFEQDMAFIIQVPLFKRLPKDQFPLMTANMEQVEYERGQEVFKQGEIGADFFIIKKGEVDILASKDGGRPVKVATLKAGDYFGEAALLRDEPRGATIKASGRETLQVMKLTRDKFQKLGLQEKVQFANRSGGTGNRVVEAKTPEEKTDEEREMMKASLDKNENLQKMVDGDDSITETLIDLMWKEELAKGKELWKTGDPPDYFYICHEGHLEILVDDKVVASITPGLSFGELSLMYLVPRSASVVAKEKSLVWAIDRWQFKNILMKISEENILEYMKYLDRVSILDALMATEKRAVAQALVPMNFPRDEIILKQGEKGDTFYILYAGEVEVIRDDVLQIKLKASKKEGTTQIFGERALLTAEPRGATVKVCSKEAKVLALDRTAFTMLLGPLQDIIQAQEEGKHRQAKVEGSKAGNAKPMAKVFRKDLVKVGLVGVGMFGPVELFEHRHTKHTFVVKGACKMLAVQQEKKHQLINEKKILFMVDSPFIVKLYETYNGYMSVYFLFEPCLGGDLHGLYGRKQIYGSEKHTKFYVACAVLALIHLHERKIAYRDLKPENMLLGEDGFMRLCDFQLSKFIIGKTFTTCGTPDYFAPEVIYGRGHSHQVDWWTVGILLFELMAGSPPFESPLPMQIYAKAMKGIAKVVFPPKCLGTVGDLIKNLLTKDPADRLPCKTGGVKNLKEHKWFLDCGWQSIVDKEIDPPYNPNIRNKLDISNFYPRKDEVPPATEYKSDGTDWDKTFPS